MVRHPCCDKGRVKKGPWTAEEDAVLKEYIEKNGTDGNWISVPKKAGLNRCGKSCRLRWVNYLRPDVRHGKFSDDEHKMITDLVNTIGRKWSVIAGFLPGRTDNDIKNYWNKKCKQRTVLAEGNKFLTNTMQKKSPKISFTPNLEASNSQLPLLAEYTTDVPTDKYNSWNIPGKTSDLYNTFYSGNNISNLLEKCSDLFINFDLLDNTNIPDISDSSLLNTPQDISFNDHLLTQQQNSYDPNVTGNNYDLCTMFGSVGDQASFGFSHRGGWNQSIGDLNIAGDNEGQLQDFTSFDATCQGRLQLQHYNKIALGQLGLSNNEDGEVFGFDGMSTINATSEINIDIGGFGFGDMSINATPELNTNGGGFGDMSIIDTNGYGYGHMTINNISGINTDYGGFKSGYMSTNYRTSEINYTDAVGFDFGDVSINANSKINTDGDGFGDFGMYPTSVLPVIDQNEKINSLINICTSNNKNEEVGPLINSSSSNYINKNVSYSVMNDVNTFYC